MNYLCLFLTALLLILVALGLFLFGAFFMCRVMEKAYEDARYAQKVDEWYRMAGYRNPGDPKPYVPPTK